MTDERPGLARRFFARYVAFAEKRAWLLIAIFMLIGAGALSAALKLELHTDMAELLPDEHPAVLALRRIAGRQKSATNLVMLVHSPDAEANRKFVEAARPGLEKMIPSSFSEIQWRPETEVPDYAAKWKWLYAELKDLENVETLLDRIIAKRGSPGYVDLEGDPEEELKKLRDQLNGKLPKRNDAAYFEAKKQPEPPPKSDKAPAPAAAAPAAPAQEFDLGVMMWRRMNGLATRGDRDTLEAVQALIRELDPAKFHPAMKVEFTGGIAQAIDEQNGIREDLTLATVTCASLVLFVIWLYFRRAALILVVGAPAVLGLLLALSLASVTIHYLNINTAFLISIILGNGINTPIILLARYGEERRRDLPVRDALVIAMSETLVGTLTAMAAASISYGCLLLTSFRGFNQFGLLGGVGMLVVWLVSFLLVPPLVIAGERLAPGILTPRGNLLRRPFTWVGGMAARRPAALALVSLVALGAAARPLVGYVRDPIEWDMNKLRTDETASQRLWNRMEALGMGDMGAGYIGNNGVLLVDKPEEADDVAEALRKQDAAKGDQHVLKTVRTLSSMLPSSQAEKLEVLSRIRRKIDRHAELMSEEERREAQAWRPPDHLRVVKVEDLPRQVLEAFTETDGQVGRLVGIDADHTTYYDWNGHDLLRMSKALKVEALGRTWYVASAATVFAGMLETIIADGPRVTMTAFVAVMVLVVFAFRLRGAVPVIASLAVGIFWLGGLLGWLDLKINFMNFVALPITLGVGADYAANIWARLRHRGESLPEVIADTGSAVVLCSLTTIIGYSSLLMSRNRALRSFGLLADLGELTCLVSALVALPALVQLWRRRRGRAG